MTKPVLIAAISSLFVFPAFAQHSTPELTKRINPGDAQVVVLGPQGAIVTVAPAISPSKDVQDMSDRSQTGHIDTVMREGDRLVL